MLYKKLIEDNLDNDKYTIRTKTDKIGYREIDRLASIRANKFYSYGLRTGDRILIINHNNLETIISILACIRNGYVFVLLHEQIMQDQINYIISDCCPKLMLDNTDIKIINITESKEAVIKTENKLFKEHNRKLFDENTLVYILYTSGTTSKPKGVVAAYHQVIFCIDAINQRIGNTKDDTIFCCLPLSFDYGLYQLFMSMTFGCSLFIINSFVVQELPKLLLQSNATGFPIVPSIMSMLLESEKLEKVKLPALRYITSTGDNFSINLIERIWSVLPDVEVYPMYGLTECKRVSVMPKGRMDKIMAGSCGLPLDGVKVELNNVIDGVGELIVYGPNVMNGYWNDIEATNDTYGFSEKYKLPYLKTGDLFKIDEEGFLYFVCRIKRIIKSNGYRLSSIDIENRLCKINGVIEACVFGLKDVIFGEKIIAYIYSNIEDITKIIRNECQSWPIYMRPHKVIVWKHELPRNANGKIDEKKLKSDAVNSI